MPIRYPISLIINIAAIVITSPISPIVILFFAVSIWALSPPAPIIDMAPAKKTKINQIIATTVIIPIVEEINLLNVETALFVEVMFPSGPKPVKPPGGAIGIDVDANKFIIIGLEFGDLR